MRELEINGGQVDKGDGCRLVLPPCRPDYGDAQIDDYGCLSRRAHYPWRPGTRLALQARFSPALDTWRGTAGFGFWNAPFGEPSQALPALPQATWFFYASAPNDLPLPVHGPGRGWFAATVDASRPAAKALIPLVPAALLAHQFAPLRRRLWPRLRQALGISFAPLISPDMGWHAYELLWQPGGCRFSIDGRVVHQTRHSPRGPLGFVCWVDNQYLVATPRGRIAFGALQTAFSQTIAVRDLTVGPA